MRLRGSNTWCVIFIRDGEEGFIILPSLIRLVGWLVFTAWRCTYIRIFNEGDTHI